MGILGYDQGISLPLLLMIWSMRRQPGKSMMVTLRRSPMFYFSFSHSCIDALGPSLFIAMTMGVLISSV